MKTILPRLAFALLACSASASPGQMRTNVTLAWNPPTNQVYSVTNGSAIETFTNKVDSYIIYASTNAAQNTTNWPKLLSVSGDVNIITVNMTPQMSFFVVTASNYWGESLPSNVAATPAAPSRDVNLRIQ